MLAIFLSVCGLWITAGFHSLTTTTVALLASGALTWRDEVEEHAAWDVFIWYGCLFAMASALNELGVTNEFARVFSGLFSG